VRASDKNKTYQDIRNHHDYRQAWNAMVEFEHGRQKVGIFIPEEISTLMISLRDLYKSALIERQMELEKVGGGGRSHENREKLRTEGPELIDRLEAAVKKRLWTKVRIDNENTG